MTETEHKNLKEGVKEIKENLQKIFSKYEDTITLYRLEIRNFHLEAIKKENKIISLHRQLEDLKNRHSKLIRRSANV